MVDRAVEQLKRDVASRDGRSRSGTSTPAPPQDLTENGEGEKMDTQYSFNSGKSESDNSANNGAAKENGNSEQSEQSSPKEQV